MGQEGCLHHMQSILPITAVNNALPLAEKRKRRSWMLLGYFDLVPQSVQLQLSDYMKRLARVESDTEVQTLR